MKHATLLLITLILWVVMVYSLLLSAGNTVT